MSPVQDKQALSPEAHVGFGEELVLERHSLTHQPGFNPLPAVEGGKTYGPTRTQPREVTYPERSIETTFTKSQTGVIEAKFTGPYHDTLRHERIYGVNKHELTQEERELSAAGYDHLVDEIRAETISTDQNARKDNGITEHTLPLSRLADVLATKFNPTNPEMSTGLDEDEVNERLERDGKNVLSKGKKKSAWRKYLECLLTMFNVLLVVAGALLYVLLGVDYHANFPNTYLGGILVAVAFINAFIEFYQLQKSEAILESFLAMIPPTCRVIRNGTLKSVGAEGLVRGDVVLVRMGDKTPADILLFHSADLKVDNSSLTGESEPQERQPLVNGTDADVRPVEAENLVFNSTMIVSGEGWGVVVGTGDRTMIGQIAALTGEETGNKSPLAKEIGRFVILMSTIAIAFAVVFFVVGITTVYRDSAAQTVTFAVSILVAFVPQGLPSVVTMLLSIAGKRMAKQNVLVKDLQGVETLGSLTLLATDKTGTLTRNQMTVTNLWSGNKLYTANRTSDGDDRNATPLTFSRLSSGMSELISAAVLNSRIKFDKVDVPFDQRQILGDATETGLARFAGEVLEEDRGGYDAHISGHPKVFEVPFNSANKWALVIVEKSHDSGHLALYIKGAPERVLAKCSTYLYEGKLVLITEEFRKSFDEAYNYMASRGHRVIAFAQSLLSSSTYPAKFTFSKENYPQSGYCFVGLMSLEDPPKHGVREAIGTLRLAGIKVIMVTGDHPKTAEAIARKINLVIGETRETLSTKTGRTVEEIYDDEVQAVVVHGDNIDGLQPWEWDNIFSKKEIVFARTSPQHKLEIVKRAQALGHIVGVTGDGVNDSPALKKADLGIAMNISGSDVSKEAANMILLDDNFASTVKGVKEGRQIFVNLKRSIQYTLSHITPEVIPQLLYVVLPVPLPLSAILILVIDLGFELFVSLSFAWDPPETEDGVMRLQPRKPVTDNTILMRKKRALKRSRSLRRNITGDIETQSITGKHTKGRHFVRRMFSVLSDFFHKPGRVFKRSFWRSVIEDALDNAAIEGETLVDAKLLSYAYLEVGLIETIGSLLAYFVVFHENGFSPSDLRRAQREGNVYFKGNSPDFINYRGEPISAANQVDALAQAQSIVYLSIFILQCFNVFAVKAKFTYPFGKQVLQNKYNFAGILGGACFGMFIIYTPPLHTVFGGSKNLSPLYWLIPVGFGVLVLAWASIRVVLMRKSIARARVEDIKGLMMFPTMRTMSMRARAK